MDICSCVSFYICSELLPVVEKVMKVGRKVIPYSEPWWKIRFRAWNNCQRHCLPPPMGWSPQEQIAATNQSQGCLFKPQHSATHIATTAYEGQPQIELDAQSAWSRTWRIWQLRRRASHEIPVLDSSRSCPVWLLPRI